MNDVTQEDRNPWEQLAIAVTTQEGPDGKEMVSIHLGTLAMSCAFVIPAEAADNVADGLSEQIKTQGRNARIKNGRLSIVQNGKLR